MMNQLPILNLSSWSTTQLVTTNFSCQELIHSDLACRNDIPNAFACQEHFMNAQLLAHMVLQPIRDRFGKFIPNSVYRGQALERALKCKPLTWVSTSQHATGQACDVEVCGVSNLFLAHWVIENLDFDQLILECYDPALGANSGWVHISYSATANRKQVLSYVKYGRQFVYVNGLVDILGKPMEDTHANPSPDPRTKPTDEQAGLSVASASAVQPLQTQTLPASTTQPQPPAYG